MACALNIVGDRWTLLVIRDMVMGSKRYFQDFLESDEKIASNILASRLKLLEGTGMITRAIDSEHARRVIYSPTAKALDLLPVMLELVRWGATHEPKTGVTPTFVRRIADDREAVVSEIRSRHSVAGKRRRIPGQEQ